MAKKESTGGRRTMEEVGGRIREKIEESYRQQTKRLEGMDEAQLVITLLGEGDKESIVRALTGIDYRALPTEKGFSPATTIYDVRENIFFADTPRIDKKVADPATYLEETTDVVLWFVPPGTQLTEADGKVFDALARRSITTLAVMDPTLFSDEEAERLAGELAEVEGLLPRVVDAGDDEAVRALSDELLRLLKERDKELLYLRIALHKETAVARWVMAAAATALGIAVMPLPGSDNLPLAALQAGLCLRIAYVYEHTLTREDLLTLMTTSVTARAGRRLAALAEELITTTGKKLPPAVRGMAVAASRGLVAAAITYGIGMACLTYYKSGLEGKIKDLTEVFRKFAEEYLKNDE